MFIVMAATKEPQKSRRKRVPQERQQVHRRVRVDGEKNRLLVNLEQGLKTCSTTMIDRSDPYIGIPVEQCM